MSYFPVDDQAAFHPKFVAAGNAAIGLWTRAGSLCKQHPTGGLIARDTALAMGKKIDIDALVRVTLWHGPGESCPSSNCPAGIERVPDDHFAFHDWFAQAGNGTAQHEKTRRDNEREAARERQRRSRANRNNSGSHAPSHTVTSSVTSQPVTPPVTPAPVPVPLTQDTYVPHQPQRESFVTDEVTSSTQTQALAGLGITDLPKIKLAIGKYAGRAVSDQIAISVTMDLLDKGGPAVKSPQGYVLTAIEKSWPEVQKLVDERDAA
jgi:hypothetical protein